MTAFDLDAYLARLGLPRQEVTPEGLRALQAGQLRAIPFENVDPLLGTIPDLDRGAIFRKTVEARRGGYCFELNTLLEDALRASGFEARRAMARVRNGAAAGGNRSHLTLIVETGGRRFLADAGFGGPGSLVPLELDSREVQSAPNGDYRLIDDPASEETVVQRRKGDGWFSLFGIDGSFVTDPDIFAANYLCATWPYAPFPKHLMLAFHDQGERIGVFDRTMTLTGPEGDSRRAFEDEADFRALVQGRLGLALSEAQLEAVWEKIATAEAPPEGR